MLWKGERWGRSGDFSEIAVGYHACIIYAKYGNGDEKINNNDGMASNQMSPSIYGQSPTKRYVH
jgi:hypothetical protein